MNDYQASLGDGAGDTRSHHERMMAGDLYIADDPAIAEAQRAAVHRMARFADEYHRDPERGQEAARELMPGADPTAFVRAPVYVDYGTNIRIGARTLVNMGLTALDVATITIGADCQIGPHVQLLTPTHPLEPQPRRDKWEAARPIVIGDNVWLGGGAIICPGVSVGENSVVAAGAVVTKDVPANVVVAGVPAKVIRTLEEGGESAAP
ncbi:sugar O-acetyltransferase [Demequina gelatinilytica]|uniref:sugar O-acetyltransferase n=1 Tax=Demequina gelatinilytica TaxID=1638980 RepID=UPI000785011B|nr:sugar O-acetyltransferase [Demequina gelatinilytica]